MREEKREKRRKRQKMKEQNEKVVISDSSADSEDNEEKEDKKKLSHTEISEMQNEKRNKFLYGSKKPAKEPTEPSIGLADKLQIAEITRISDSSDHLAQSTERNQPPVSNVVYTTKSMLDDDTIEKLRREETEKRHREYRFETRKSADDFLCKILDLKIFTPKPKEMKAVADKYESYYDYRSIWHPLFEYE